MKDFRVFTQPSIADPTHQIAVTEHANGESVKHFSSIQPLLDAAIEVECARANAEGFNRGIDYALELFGISREQYMAKLKESK